MFVVVQVVGALLVLTCFLLAQYDRLQPSSYVYLVPNLLGSGAMTWTALIAHEWGFVLLEGIWALVSLYGLGQRLTGTEPRTAH